MTREQQDANGSTGDEHIGVPVPSLDDVRPSPTDESALRGPLAMVKVGHGDAEAFQAVYDAYRDDVYAFLARIVLDSDAADDLLQDTFLRVFREAARYDPCRPLAPWIFRIARNLAVDYLRSRRRRAHASMTAPDESTIDVPDESRDPVEEAAAREREALLREGLKRLRPSQREIFVLIDLEGRKYEEVASLLGISVKAVGARLRKARRRFLNWAKPHEKQLTDASTIQGPQEESVRGER